MSRTNPTNVTESPITKFVQWKGGKKDGYWEIYDKETKQKEQMKYLSFMYLDSVTTITGWNEVAQDGITSNMVRNLQEDILNVYWRKTREQIGKGVYGDIKTKIKMNHGKFTTVVFGMMLPGDELVKISFVGAALGPWIEFQKEVGGKRKMEESDFAIFSNKFEDIENDAVTFRAPLLEKKELKKNVASVLKSAASADRVLQDYLTKYFGGKASEIEEEGDLTVEQVMKRITNHGDIDSLIDDWGNIVRGLDDLPEADWERVIDHAEVQAREWTGTEFAFNSDGTAKKIDTTEEEIDEELPF